MDFGFYLKHQSVTEQLDFINTFDKAKKFSG